ncbi:unnamed protein product [Rotaria socialis]|uniref:mRNA-decapping enzyme C-terminal domain-containing protein n=1 Tax=Rotaria socialis TaxID=392032 RepID=A0A817UD20_9BILA|nr:unnamed protein product [Rotaria socialis]CAF3329138.1 unnamed protein product [Rotaria socialis]CAF3388343.1 unnamed protein product [Rotaria socialis]CAF3460198.1 unnamed protein product [Rotaria socialis]CAF3651711.1 unnamed protein product [Rotaria socialis]
MSFRCSPILNPNASSIKTNSNSISLSSQIRLELSKILLQHDPNAIRLYDFINHVKISYYNANECRWENHLSMEGNLFIYEKKFVIDNQAYSSYAFAIINGKQQFIQQINLKMSQYADKQSLFYEVVINNKCEVYCLHFVNENECQRLNTFISQAIESMRNIEQQRSQVVATNGISSAEAKRQHALTNISSQQTSTEVRSSRQTLTPIVNSNSSSQDQTSSLKRLLNIQHQNDSEEKNPINLLPPSSFQLKSSADTPNHLMPLNRSQFRDVLLDLVQNNDHFLDIIHQAVLNYSMQ